MSNLWLTSDTHLGHKFVSRLRGYETPDEHDAALARTWTKQVRADDEVWVLGDLALGGWAARISWFGRVPGRKHLVLGNHDRAHPLNRNGHEHLDAFRAVFATVQTAASISLGAGRVMLSHFPYSGDHGEDRYPEWRLRDAGVPLVHGHTHGTERLTRSPLGTPQVHVGLDAWGQRLVHRTEVTALLA
jgi:calcineurin-like phosphoesterase family protein